MKWIKKLLGRGEDTRPICSAIVPAAGSASRMGGENKMLLPLDGIPVLARTLLALDGAQLVDEIVVAAREQDILVVADLCKQYGIKKSLKIVRGGENRLESVLLASMECREDAAFLAVHDGARPLISQRVITDTLEKCFKYGAAAPAIPVKDTIKVAKNGLVTQTPEREKLMAVQTPQAFDADLLRAAIKNARENRLTVTDDCSCVESIGMRAFLSTGEERNLKITTPIDLNLAEIWLKKGE